MVKRNRPGALLLRALLLSLAVAAPCLAGDEQGKKEPEAKPHVKAVRAVAGEIPVVRRVHGVVALGPDDTGTTVARATGFVVSVDAADGAIVAAAQPILHLDDRAGREALAKAERAVESAKRELERAESFSSAEEERALELEVQETKAAVAVAEKESRRKQDLFERGMAPEKAAIEARTAFDSATRIAQAAERKLAAFRDKGKGTEAARLKAAVALAEADVGPARRAIEDAVVRASTGGRLTALEARVGQWVDGGARVAVVVREAGASVRVGLPPDLGRALRPGARVRLAGADAWTGALKTVASVAEPDSGFLRAWVDLSSGEFRLDQPVALEVESGEPVKGTLLPLTALDGQEAPPRVVVVEAGVAKGRSAPVLARDARRVVVQADAVPAGVLVVVEGNYNLADGTAVEVEEVK